MDSIVEKLAEIEKTAEAIVEHAEAQKYEVERGKYRQSGMLLTGNWR